MLITLQLPEIWEQTEGKITHIFACTGTGGTFSGSAKFLKEQNPNIKVIGVDADGSILKLTTKLVKLTNLKFILIKLKV
jgi:cysteine synthase